MYRYDSHALAELYDIHSADRLRTYVAAAGSVGDAFELYVWNTVVASRFHGALQAVEVGLRNACHRELSAYLGPAWYTDAAFLALDPDLKGMIRSARKFGAAPGDVVANLSFFFWTSLFSPSLDPWLWTMVMKDVLPSAAPRNGGVIQVELDKVRDLRNRVAHLEPLHKRNLIDDIERIERVCKWVHPTLEKWVRDYNALTTVLVSQPDPGADPPRGKPPWKLPTF